MDIELYIMSGSPEKQKQQTERDVFGSQDVGVGKSETYRTGQQAGNSSSLNVAVLSMKAQFFFLCRRPQSFLGGSSPDYRKLSYFMESNLLYSKSIDFDVNHVKKKKHLHSNI